jgi:hypothetical protein
LQNLEAGLSVNGQTPRPLRELLLSGDIAKLKTEAEQRRQLLQRVRADLPDDTAGHVVSARLDPDGQLVVGVDSAAWAAKLRYERDSLLDRGLKVRVVAPG